MTTELRLVKPRNPVLIGSDQDAYRWLEALYERQTASEQVGMMTTDLNGQGFNAFDAPILSHIAAKAKRYGSLTPKQAALVRRKLVKYAGQLRTMGLL